MSWLRSSILSFIFILAAYTARVSSYLDITTPSFCVSRWSVLSGKKDDATATVMCDVGEVMTGCGSFLPHGSSGSRDGDYIETDDNGDAVCVAQNGANGQGVHAIARCCVWQDMECYYIEGEKSSCHEKSTSIAQCSDRISGLLPYPTDCMSFTPDADMDGVMPDAPDQVTFLQDFDSRSCVAKNGYGGDGVNGYAACCSAPDLQCKSKWSEPSSWLHFDTADVRCDYGWQMTGCMGFTFWKMIDGAYIEDITHNEGQVESICKAYQGGNAYSVWAVAICCRIRPPSYTTPFSTTLGGNR
ncbi:proprotein convertase subtilisin/kexin type 9-like [Ptychodera flava]|uniref:proprotein convertase subtilisin/kexin type 9-like n=1 Tax=Ptychodera flava TaxID=63121 RepID=UPI003969EFD5